MKIYTNIYEDIMTSQREKPPEFGGILGGRNNIITSMVIDMGMKTDIMCSYTPNVNCLNKIIKQWHHDNITFMGIFHTHFWGVDTFSLADKKYIDKIMRSMPNEIEYLYFPLVVMPQRLMICYKALLIRGRLAVEIESLNKIQMI